MELEVGVFLALALNALHTELSAGVEHKVANVNRRVACGHLVSSEMSTLLNSMLCTSASSCLLQPATIKQPIIDRRMKRGLENSRHKSSEPA